MSDLVRIRNTESGRWLLSPNKGTTPNKAEAHLYAREEAQRIKNIATWLVELEPVEPAPCQKCAELAAAFAMYGWHRVDGECDQVYIPYDDNRAIFYPENKCNCGFHEALETANSILAAHDAAKDAEIARLREELEKAKAIAARQLAEPIEGKEDTGAFFDICTVIEAALEGGKA